MSAMSAWALAGALWVGCLLEGPWWLAPTGLAMLAVAAAVRDPASANRKVRLAAAMLALAAVGAGLAGGRATLRDGGLLPALAADGRPVELEGTVASEPRPLPPRDGEATTPAWFVVRVTDAGGRRVRERAVVRVDDLDAAPAVGERVRLTATPRKLGDDGFDDHLRRLHVGARLDVVDLDVAAPAGAVLASTTAVRDRSREAFARRLDEERAVLLAGLVVGDPRVRAGERADHFTDAGLTHLVVVSGRHVALMLAVVLGAAALARVGARGRVWVGLVAVAWFAVLVRWQPSVLRAAAMAALVLGAGLLGRGRDPRHVLAMATVLLLLADPALAGQGGFSLSVLATGGVLVVTPWLAERLPGPRPLRLTVAATLGAQTGAAPVLLAWFDGLPIWSVPANVIAVPAAGLAQVLGMVAAVGAQASVAVGGLLAAAAGPPLSVVLWAADTFAAGPRIQVGHLLSPVTLLLVVAGARWRRAPRQACGALALAAVLAAWPLVRPAPDVARLAVTVLDVGQGDAVLVEVPAGPGRTARLLYDGGPDDREVAAALRAGGIRQVDVVVMSHPHHDHVAGVAAVVRDLDVGVLVEGPSAAHAHDEPVPDAVDAAREAAAADGTPLVTVSAGQRFTLGDAGVEVLSPPAAGFPGGTANDHSVVLRVSTADGRVLLTGDAEATAQQRMLARPEQVQAHLVQVPHHGGDTNAEGFLATVGAETAFISVGDDNPYGHPHPGVLDELAGTRHHRTDEDGTLRYELDAGAVQVVEAGPSRSSGRGPSRSRRRTTSAGPGRRAGAGPRPPGRPEPAPDTLPPVSDRPPMYLFAGSQELLLRRAAQKLLDELRAGGDLDVTDLRAAELGDGGLPDLRTASLFGAPRAVLIRDAQDLPATASATLLAELDGAPPDATVILCATGTGRIRKLAARIKELGGRVDVAPPREWEHRRWEELVADEYRRHGRTADRQAVAATLDHAGRDVAVIAEKVAQVAATAPPGRVGAEQVEEVVVGHGSRGSFAVADAMCERRPDEALTLLRGVLESGDDPVMVLGALTYRLRQIVAVAGNVPPRSVGLSVSEGQAKRLKGLRGKFGPGELTRAYRALADADREIKGGELPPALAVERAVVEAATRS